MVILSVNVNGDDESGDVSAETNGDGSAIKSDNAGVSVNEDGVHVQGAC